MKIVDVVKHLLDDAVGGSGAVRNCRRELVRRRVAERDVDRVCRRIPALVPTTDDATTSIPA